ncbi:hypothetical protein RMBD61P2_26370 [Enterococcus faecalis]
MKVSLLYNISTIYNINVGPLRKNDVELHTMETIRSIGLRESFYKGSIIFDVTTLFE